MIIVIQTQVLENYAAHDGFTGEHRWKAKGGNTYIVEGVSVNQAQDKGFWELLENAVQCDDNRFREYTIFSDLVDDDVDTKTFCDEWELPIMLTVKDGIVNFTKTDLFYNAEENAKKGQPIGSIVKWSNKGGNIVSRREMMYYYEDGSQISYSDWMAQQENVG